MADLDVGISGLGGKLRGHIQALPPGGWVGLVVIVVVVVLSWHSWRRDVEDATSWTDPHQPPLDVADPGSGIDAGPLTARSRRWPGSIPGAC